MTAASRRCEDCRKSRDVDGVPTCARAMVQSFHVCPTTSVVVYAAFAACSAQRRYPWPLDVLAGMCGRRGRFYAPKDWYDGEQ